MGVHGEGSLLHPGDPVIEDPPAGGEEHVGPMQRSPSDSMTRRVGLDAATRIAERGVHELDEVEVADDPGRAREMLGERHR